MKEIAQEFKDFVEPNEEELQKMLNGKTTKENNGETPKENVQDDNDDDIKMEDEKTLLVKEVKIDVDLFKEDEIEDIPDDEGDVPENQ